MTLPMRIVAGRFKGRQIATPPGRDTRPTSDRAREAIFNVLAHANWAPEFNGARVLDLFAGSGALGFEAISRGASHCLFVESDASARAAIRTNTEAFGLTGAARIHRRSATDLGVRPTAQAPYDIAFLDPPYGRDLAAQAINGLLANHWLGADGVIVAETEIDAALEPQACGLEADKTYGKARVRFFTVRSS